MVNDAIFESVSMAASGQNSILPPLRLQPLLADQWQPSGRAIRDCLTMNGFRA